jgi:hypothetical protein
MNQVWQKRCRHTRTARRRHIERRWVLKSPVTHKTDAIIGQLHGAHQRFDCRRVQQVVGIEKNKVLPSRLFNA